MAAEPEVLAASVESWSILNVCPELVLRMKEEKLIKRDNDEERNTSESVQRLELSNTYSQHETHFTSYPLLPYCDTF